MTSRTEVAIVFDCNIYITCAILTGVPFTFTRLLSLQAHDREDENRRLALLRAYAGGTSTVHYSVYWSDHIIEETRKHLRNAYYWTSQETWEYITTLQTQLIDYSGGCTLHHIGEGWGDLTDHEDRIVYETAMDLVKNNPLLNVLFVTADHEFLRKARERCNRGHGSERRILPMGLTQFLSIGS